jgi:small subunit ribosomal protein S20
MPIIQSAKKKMRIDIRRKAINLRTKRIYKEALKDAIENPTPDSIKKASSQLDTAAKKKVIHKNKASRLKSRLAKKLSSK